MARPERLFKFEGQFPVIRLYDLRHAEAVSQAELAGRLDVAQGAISKLEHSEDVRISTLRQYLEALGACLDSSRCSRTKNDASRSTSVRTRHLTRSPLAPWVIVELCHAICHASTYLPTPTSADEALDVGVGFAA